MNAKELATVLDQLGCAEINIGVGKGIHDMIKEESGESKNCIAPEYYGRKYYRVQELEPDEIVLQVKQIGQCIVSYSKLVEIYKTLSTLMHGVKPVTVYQHPDLVQKDNLDMLLTLDENFKHGKLTVIRE